MFINGFGLFGLISNIFRSNVSTTTCETRNICMLFFFYMIHLYVTKSLFNSVASLLWTVCPYFLDIPLSWIYIEPLSLLSSSEF